MPGLFSSLSSLIFAVGGRLANWPRAPRSAHLATTSSYDEQKGPLMEPLHPILQELRQMIEGDADLYMGFHQMFEQIPNDSQYHVDPLGKPQIRDYLGMLKRFNVLLKWAPEFHDGETGHVVPLPFVIMLTWPMCTPAGLRVFTNPIVNTQLRKILNAWGDFLSSPASCYVLTDKPNGWFSAAARERLSGLEETFECDPTKEYWGFTSWDDFFTRTFRPGVRPINHPEDDAVITSGCESVTYKISHNVQPLSPFWLKGEPYSLYHMLNNDPLSPQFVGGTVYQAYLNAFSYHRWHSPINGTVTKIVHVPGTYCAISPSTGFESGNPNRAAPAYSQAFMTSLATRTLIFVQADNANIGLMCFIAVGMIEISSCEATVAVGQRVRKGDQLGMFHYGGSTYCLIFRPQTKIVFSDAVQQSLKDQKTVVLLNDSIGFVSKESE